MQCDYCGQEILGLPLEVDLSEAEFSPESDLPQGQAAFCSEACLNLYLDEAGVSLETDVDPEEMEEDALRDEDEAGYPLAFG